MQEINAQQILRVVADTQVVIQIAVNILALCVLPVLDLVLAGGTKRYVLLIANPPFERSLSLTKI